MPVRKLNRRDGPSQSRRDSGAVRSSVQASGRVSGRGFSGGKNNPRSGRCAYAPQVSFERSDIALAKASLTPFFKSWQKIAAREFVDRVRAEIEQKCDLTGTE